MSLKKRTGLFICCLATALLSPKTARCVGYMLVYACDSSSSGSPPPGAVAYLDGGVTNQAFGTSDWILFSNLEAGIHTVEVTTATGFLPRESGSVENSISDPDSAYGIPRHVEVVDNETALEMFMFDPIVTVSATVRDIWTMERLEGASIEFVVNRGTSSNLVYRKYPWHAEYATNWSSDAEGLLPSNTYLYVSKEYDLVISNSGYQVFISNDVVTASVSAGDAISLEEIFLQPLDDNTNLIADAWETLHFGTGSNVLAEADADGDGMSNRDEYIAGTDPTNQLSFLSMDNMVFSTNQLELTWGTQSWRTYRIVGTTDLCTQDWVQVAGSWEATNGQTQMSWVETNLDLSWHSSYRVEVVPCDWQGTNQVLVNTNTWSGGGSGGGTNGPPIP